MGIPKIIAAASMVDVLAASYIASRILEEAAKRAGSVADLLEKIEEITDQEEDQNDIRM